MNWVMGLNDRLKGLSHKLGDKNKNGCIYLNQLSHFTREIIIGTLIKDKRNMINIEGF